MPPIDHNALARLIDEVLGSAKYAAIAPDLVHSVAQRELAARRNHKEAVKATKNKLHQVGGAYLAPSMLYERWLATLRDAAGDPAALRQTCLPILAQHASTRERLPILDRFFGETLGEIGPINAVLDVACGLNPLTLSWMPLAEGANYYACDIYADMMAFVGAFLDVARVSGEAFVCDLVSAPPTVQADVALALKVLPVLEQVQKGAAARLLQALNTRWVLASFPAQSLGGRNKGMIQNYAAMLDALVADQPWQVRRFDFPGELAFLIDKAPV